MDGIQNHFEEAALSGVSIHMTSKCKKEEGLLTNQGNAESERKVAQNLLLQGGQGMWDPC